MRVLLLLVIASAAYGQVNGRAVQVIPPKVSGGGGGTGTVTNNGNLVSNQLAIGDALGTTKIKSLGSLGTNVLTLHGNASGAPTFGYVVLTTDVSGILPLANGGTGNASPTGVASGNSACVMTGSFPNQTITCTFTGGSGTVTHSAGALIANQLMLGNGGADSQTVGSLGTTSTVLHGNASGPPTFNAVALASDVSGLLPVANGGSGTSTPALVAGSGITLSGSWPNQTVAAIGGGGGASQTFQITDWTASRTSGTVITNGNPCLPAAPCNVSVGGTVYQFTGGPYTATVSNAHTGKVCQYISNAGVLSLAVGGASLVTGDIAVSAGQTLVGVSGGNCPADSTKLYQWTITAGVNDTALASFQLASYLNYRPSVTGGRGITVTPGSSDTIASTAAITSACVGNPGNSTAAYGDFCVDNANVLYVCKNLSNCTVAADWASAGAGGSTVTFSPPYLVSGGLNYGPVMGPFTPVVDANFAWVNQGGATLSYYNGAAFLTAPTSAGNNLRLRVMTAPATPYSIIMAVVPQMGNVNYNTCGMATYESGSGKVVAYQFLQGSNLSVDHYTNVTTFASNPITMNVALTGAPIVFMKIRNDGTNITYSYSTNNANDFTTVGSELIGAGFTTAADKVGFFCDANNSTYTAAQLILGWKQGT